MNQDLNTEAEKQIEDLLMAYKLSKQARFSNSVKGDKSMRICGRYLLNLNLCLNLTLLRCGRRWLMFGTTAMFGRLSMYCDTSCPILPMLVSLNLFVKMGHLSLLANAMFIWCISCLKLQKCS